MMFEDLTQYEVFYITNNGIKYQLKDTVLTGHKVIYYTTAQYIRISTFMQLHYKQNKI
jgi:hypothetical protein